MANKFFFWLNLLKKILPLAVAFALVSPSAVAATESDFFAELPVVLSVSRLAQPQREAPGAVTVIDQELIRASGARVLSDLLRFVPGFQVTAPSQEAARVTYHGLGEEFPSRVQVLVDGVSQYSPLYKSGVNWNLIPVALEDIERIEVLRGSNSAAYGANAFLGVINIITQHPAQTRGGAFSVNSGHGGIDDVFARWGGSAPGADFRLSVREQADNGIDGLHDDRRNRVVSLRGAFYPSDKDELQLNFNETTSTTGRGGSGVPLHNFLQRNQTVQAGWRHTVSSTEEFRMSYAMTREFADEAHVETAATGGFTFILNINEGGRSERHDLEAQHSFSPHEKVRMVWGVGAQFLDLNQPLYFFGDIRQTRNTARTFANVEWKPSPEWNANLGGTWEHDSLSGATLSPRLTIHRHINEENTLRFGVSRAYRPPTLNEARGDYRFAPINSPFPNLLQQYKFAARGVIEPERVISQEIGYIGEFRQKTVSIDARLFRERIPNRILTVPWTLTGAPYCPNPNAVTNRLTLQCGSEAVDYAVNGQTVDINGFEYQARWQPAPDTRLLLNQSFVNIDASLLDIKIKDDPANITKITTHTKRSAPNFSTTLMLIQKLPYDLEVSLTQHEVAEMKWTANSNVPAYHRTDWRIAKSFRVGSNNAEVAYTGRSTTTEHGEFRDSWVVFPRHFFSVRVGL